MASELRATEEALKQLCTHALLCNAHVRWLQNGLASVPSAIDCE